MPPPSPTTEPAESSPPAGSELEQGSFESALAVLFRERFAMLYRYLERMTGNAALADDTAQEAFVRLHSRGAMPRDPGAWLVSVANNLVRDEYRTATRRRRLLALWVTPAERKKEPATPDDLVLAGERETAIREALASLPLRDRRILLLRQEGFSYREIAEALDVAVTSIGTLLARATAALTLAYHRSSHASD